MALTILDHLCCPLCRRPLERRDQAFRCGPCGRDYPIILGIPDLRVYEDPLIPLQDDYRKAEKLQAAAESRTFAELVEYYWSLPTVPPTQPALMRRFVHHVLTDDQRIARYDHLLGTGESFLEVGCGPGMLLRAAQRRFPAVVGCDVGFRWVVVARKGLEELGAPAHLVCCCGDHLPFPPATFDSVATVAVLEHVANAGAVLGECRRVARPVGRLFVWTTNRWSLAPEPHVRLWGVGFLPRRWMPAYVRWRRGLAYEKKRILSRPELSRTLRTAGFRRLVYHPPPVTAADLDRAGGAERWAGKVYAVLCRVGPLRALLTWIAPVLLVTVVPRASTSQPPSR